MPETNAPAPAAPVAAPSQQVVTMEKPDAAPAAAASEAARTLRQRRDEIRQKLTGEAPKTAVPVPATDAPVTAAALAAWGDDDEIAVLIETQRDQRDTARKLTERAGELDAREAALKEHEQHLPAIRAAREHAGKGDMLSAARAIFTPAQIQELVGAFVGGGGTGDPDAPTPVDLDAEFEKRFTAREAARLADEEKKRTDGAQALSKRRDAHDGVFGAGFGGTVVGLVKTALLKDGSQVELAKAPPDVVGEIIDGYADFITATLQEWKQTAASYPAMSRFRPPVSEIVRHTEKLRLQPDFSNAKVLKAIEDELAESIRSTPYGVAAPAAPAKPAPTVTSGWRASPGQEEPAPATGPRSLDAIRADRKARLLSA